MSSVLLVYPFFRRARDRSRFRFPPLGVAYVAAALRLDGHDVRVLDCTFLDRDEALSRALAESPDVVGIYAMVTMVDDCLWFARRLRERAGLLVAGGPMPTCEPETFLDDFDVVVRGEGETTMREIVAAYEEGAELAPIAGTVCRRASATQSGPATSPAPAGLSGPATSSAAPARPFERDLDAIAFPARDLLPNAGYIEFGRAKYGHAVTTLMSTRGCPFRCEFCSNVVFGESYRERSPANVVDEIETALALGYDFISFADDVFTLDRRRTLGICAEIRRRGLRFPWECLGRVDSFDEELGRAMFRAGCTRIFFGIESGNDAILALMRKQITTSQARDAVHAAHRAGLEVGAFFIVYYPGDSDDTVLDTLRFAASLPLDYLGLTMPYPLPGTALHARVGERVTRAWRQTDAPLLDHVLTFDAGVSAFKMRFALVKGHAQFRMKRRLGGLAPPALTLFERPTDAILRLVR